MLLCCFCTTYLCTTNAKIHCLLILNWCRWYKERLANAAYQWATNKFPKWRMQCLFIIRPKLSLSSSPSHPEMQQGVCWSFEGPEKTTNGLDSDLDTSFQPKKHKGKKSCRFKNCTRVCSALVTEWMNSAICLSREPHFCINRSFQSCAAVSGTAMLSCWSSAHGPASRTQAAGFVLVLKGQFCAAHYCLGPILSSIICLPVSLLQRPQKCKRQTLPVINTGMF